MEKYNLTSQATEDLYQIWEYTVDTWSEKQADKYYSLLTAAFREIASDPLSIGEPYDVILPGLRAYHAGRHMVFYTLRGDWVLIVPVLHEKMDFARHF